MLAKGEVKNNSIYYNLNSNLFSKEALFKCLYWYSKQFIIDLDSENNTNNYCIKMTPKDDLIDLESILPKLNQDFIDYNLRDIVTKETQNIRDLITAKAFSNGEFDEDPPGEIDDPIGFRFKDFL